MLAVELWAMDSNKNVPIPISTSNNKRLVPSYYSIVFLPSSIVA